MNSFQTLPVNLSFLPSVLFLLIIARKIFTDSMFLSSRSDPGCIFNSGTKDGCPLFCQNRVGTASLIVTCGKAAKSPDFADANYNIILIS